MTSELCPCSWVSEAGTYEQKSWSHALYCTCSHEPCPTLLGEQGSLYCPVTELDHGSCRSFESFGSKYLGKLFVSKPPSFISSLVAYRGTCNRPYKTMALLFIITSNSYYRQQLAAMAAGELQCYMRVEEENHSLCVFQPLVRNLSGVCCLLWVKAGT